MKNEELKKWFYVGDKVRLIFKDGTELFITREAFNRSFQPIITSPKSAIIRDFKSYIC